MNTILYFVNNRRLEATALIICGLLTASLLLAAKVFQNYNATGSITIAATSIGVIVVLATLLIAAIIHWYGKQLRWLTTNGYQNPEQYINYYSSLTLTHLSTLLTGAATIAIATVSLGLFLSTTATAFEWPGIDMGPFFERYADPTFAPNDFFTNASTDPNPRHIFGYLVLSIGTIFGADWYTTYFGLRIFFVISVPILFFLTLRKALCHHVQNESRQALAILLAASATLLPFVDRINGIFSIGWWVPLNLIVMPQTAALFFGLSYSALSIGNPRYLYTPLLVIATLLHPTIGISCFMVYVLLDGTPQRWQWYALQSLGGLVLPLLAITMTFSSTQSYSASEFVYHYIYENHSFHYFPSQLGNYTSLPWHVCFGVQVSALLCLLGFARLRKDRYLTILTLLIVTLYIGAVGLQYIFVELWPIKSLAVLGPIRFTMFGYWLTAYLGCYTIARHLPTTLLPFYREIKLFSTARYLWAGILFVLILLIIGGMRYQDNPITTFNSRYPNLTAWVQTNTTASDVFGVFPDFPPTHVPLILKRAVYFGNGFPFTEDGFAEHNERKKLLFGSQSNHAIIPGQPWAKAPVYYRQLLPADFVNAAKAHRLDYIVVETAFRDQFAAYNAIFTNEKIAVYRVADFLPN